MRYVAMTYNAAGRLTPYRGVAGIEIRFHAKDQADAERKAQLNGIPRSVLLMPDQLVHEGDK